MSSEVEVSEENSVLRVWYSKHFDLLVSFLRTRFGPGPPDPEDIAQRTFSRLLERPALDQVTNPRAFLWRIAHNLMVSEHRATGTAERRLENLRVLSELDEGYLLVPERVLEAQEQMQIALQILEAMPEKRRNILMMVRVDGCSQREVAARMGISAPAVSKHLGKATAELYDALKRRSDSGD